MQLFISRKVTLYCHICLVIPRERSFFTDTSVVVIPQKRLTFLVSAVWLFPKKGLSLQPDPSWLFPKKDSSLFTHHMCKRFLKKENFTECEISGGRSNIVEPCDFLCACVRACVRACVCCIWPKDTTAVIMPLFHCNSF